MENTYYLLDSRAGSIAVQNDGVLDTENNGKYIVYVGTLKECCKYANNRHYGDLCIITDSDYTVLWELLNAHGHWVLPKIKNF